MMQLFHDYIQPLIFWLNQHPETALGITFFIAFIESLAIIGSIVPGSVTMTAIGILAGTGVIRIDLTLIVASLGAICGDGISYLLGYYFRERLAHLWPFNHYPNLLAYGQYYFEKHGGKSVLIGRFVGPLRSIIPVIAGMMHMAKGRFFFANVLSGVGWAILYVTPGILIGAASHELSPERATRLVLIILFFLVGVWLLSIGIKSLFLHLRTMVAKGLNKMWHVALHLRCGGGFFKLLTPTHESNHVDTVILSSSVIVNVLLITFLVMLHDNETLFLKINQPVYFLIQTMRTHAFDLFFAMTQQALTLLSVMAMVIYLAVFYLLKRNVRGLLLWLGLMILSFLLVNGLPILIPTYPFTSFESQGNIFLLSVSLIFSGTIYIAVLFHNRQQPHSLSRKCFTFLLFTALIGGGLSFVYFGVIWLTDFLVVSLVGMVGVVIYWLIYRKIVARQLSEKPFFSLVGSLILICSTLSACYIGLSSVLENYQIYFTQHVLSLDYWWNQDKPILPVHCHNRVGKIYSVFNVQYAGDIYTLLDSLNEQGWESQAASFLNKVMKHVEGKSRLENPLAASVYLNRKPFVTLLYQPQHKHYLIRLQLWRSNYYLESIQEPIWLGYIQLLSKPRLHSIYAQDPALNVLKRSLKKGFQWKQIIINQGRAKYLLLIQPVEIH